MKRAPVVVLAWLIPAAALLIRGHIEPRQALAQATAAPAAWSPLEIPGVIFFSDAANTNRLWKETWDSTAVTHATADGDVIGLVQDAGPGAHNVFAASSTRTPILASGGGRNSHFAWSSNKVLTVHNSLAAFNCIHTTKVWTIAIWAKCGADGTAMQLLDNLGGGGTTGNAGIWLQKRANNAIEILVGRASAGNAVVPDTSTTDTFTVADGWQCITIIADGTNCNVQIGSRTPKVITMGTAGASTVNASFNLDIGAQQAPSTYWNGNIGGVFISNTIVEAGQLAKLRAYNPARNTLPSGSVLGTGTILRPEQLGSLYQWHDFSDTTTLWQDTSRTTPVAADGDPIALAENKTGIGLRRWLSTSTSGDRPLYKVNTLNGRGSALWDQTDDNLDFVSTWFGVGSWSMMLVVKNTHATLGCHVFSGGNYLVVTSKSYTGNVTPNVPYFVIHPLNNIVGQADPSSLLVNLNDDWNIIEVVRDGPTWTTRVNGTNEIVTTPQANGWTMSSMGDPSIASWRGMRVAEVCIWNAPYSRNDLAKVRKWLSAKWAMGNVTTTPYSWRHQPWRQMSGVERAFAQLDQRSVDQLPSPRAHALRISDGL